MSCRTWSIICSRRRTWSGAPFPRYPWKFSSSISTTSPSSGTWRRCSNAFRNGSARCTAEHASTGVKHPRALLQAWRRMPPLCPSSARSSARPCRRAARWEERDGGSMGRSLSIPAPPRRRLHGDLRRPSGGFRVISEGEEQDALRSLRRFRDEGGRSDSVVIALDKTVERDEKRRCHRGRTKEMRFRFLRKGNELSGLSTAWRQRRKR